MSLPRLAVSRTENPRALRAVVPTRTRREHDSADHGADSAPDRGGARKVLVAVDDPVLAELVPASLRFAGYETHLVRTGADTLALRDEVRPHLLVLDAQLRGPDVVTVARQLRRRDGHPILFLTPPGSFRSPALTLTVGGDDYLARPFSLDELTARVRAVLRRAGHTGIPTVLRFADLEYNEDTQAVHRAGTLVRLTPRERHILRHFLINAGRTVTRAHIHDHVWPYDHTSPSRSIDVHICTLRRKLDDHGPPLIATLHGTGYLLQSIETAPSPADASDAGQSLQQLRGVEGARGPDAGDHVEVDRREFRVGLHGAQ